MILPAVSRRHVVRYQRQTRDLLAFLPKNRFEDDDQIRLLEKKFAEFVGVKHALAVSSGRVSLEVILNALDLPKKGEVIMPAYTYHSVPDAIRNAGLVPVFADIDPVDNNLDPEKVAEKINPNTVAVLATHIFGHPCRLDELKNICDKAGVVLLEDCAHTIGGTFAGKQVGTFGQAGFFSFGATKVFNTYGGGIAVTDDDALAKEMRKQLAQHGPPDKKGLIKTITIFSLLHLLTRRWPFTLTMYPVLRLIDAIKMDVIGLYNKTFKKTAENISIPVRYSNLQAAIALHQLDTIDSLNKIRKANARALDERLDPDIPRLRPVKNADSVWYFFAIGVDDPKESARELLKYGIDTGMNIMDDCAQIAGEKEEFPITKWWRAHSLQIPIHPPLGFSDMEKIAEAINKVVKPVKLPG